MDRVVKKKAEAWGRQLAGFWGEETWENLKPLFLHQRFIYPEFLFNYAWRVDSMGAYLHNKRGDWIPCCGASTFQDALAILFVSSLIISGIL